MSLWNPYNWFRSKVWRTHKDLGGKFNGWNTETENKLKIDIEKTVGGEPLNILLVGAASNGKSSTINSIFSIMNGRISCRSNAGSLGESFTIKYRQIQGNGPFKNIFFYDTSGIEEQNGPTIQDIEDALSGGKKPGVKFVAQEKSKDNEKKKELEIHCIEKKKELEIHCIIYVLDAESVKHGLRMSTRKKLEDIVKAVREEPTRVVFLTKIDNISSDVYKDNKKMFSCDKVKNLVAQTAGLMSIDEGLIYPIRNYVNEQDLSTEINIPLLLALKKVVGFASDCRMGKTYDNIS